MKTFNESKAKRALNEAFSFEELQIGIVLGILGLKGISALIHRIAGEFGSRMEVGQEKLRKVVDEMIRFVEDRNKSGVDLDGLRMVLLEKIDSGEIRTYKDIDEYFKGYY